MNKNVCVLGLFFWALSIQCLKADFFVQVRDASPSTYLPGGTGTLEVWGRHTELVPISLNGWTLSFDLSDNSVWDLGATSASNAITGVAMSYFNDPSFSPNNYDFGFRTDAIGAFSMNSNQDYKLFDINFTIAASAAPGSYDLNFVANALNTFVPALPIILTSDANSVAYNGFLEYKNPPALQSNAVAGFQGQFTVVAVPEPSSLALVGLVGVGLGFYRRRRAGV